MPTEDDTIHLCDVDTSDPSVRWSCPTCGIEWGFSEVALGWKPVSFPTIEMM